MVASQIGTAEEVIRPVADRALRMKLTTMEADLTSLESTDSELLSRSVAGDLTALGVLYDRHRVAAYSLAVRITADAALAEDVVQEAFLGLWRNAVAYRPERGAVRGWLLSIVHHRAIDALRRRRSIDGLPEADDPVDSRLTAPDIWPEVASRLDRSAITAALDRLNPAQREAIELAYYRGLTQQAMAEHLGIPLGTVKGRIRLGLRALRDALIAAGSVDVDAADGDAASGRDGRGDSR